MPAVRGSTHRDTGPAPSELECLVAETSPPLAAVSDTPLLRPASAPGRRTISDATARMPPAPMRSMRLRPDALCARARCGRGSWRLPEGRDDSLAGGLDLALRARERSSDSCHGSIRPRSRTGSTRILLFWGD